MISSKSESIYHIDWLSSVWRIDTANPFVDRYDIKTHRIRERHTAPYPEELPHRLISIYSKKGEYVLDPFCGSGTTNFAAITLFRKTIGYDIEQKYIDLAKERCNKKGMFFCKSFERMDEVFSNSIRLCVTSPPYMHLRKYSDNPDNIGNIKDPYPSLRNVFKEVHRVLKKNGIFCMNVGGVPQNKFSEWITFPFDMLKMCLELGFKYEATVIWDKGMRIRKRTLEFMEICENHEYVWVLQKQ